MRPVDVFAIAVAIVIALLSLIVEPWSGPWWIALLAAAFVALWALLHIVLGGTARRIGRLTAILFLTVGIPSFGTWYYLRYPTSSKIMQAWFPSPATLAKPLSPVASAPRNITSTFSKAYYNCKATERALDNAAIEKRSATFKSFIEPYAEAYAYKPPTITVVPGGDKVELVPLGNTPVSVPTKRVFQIVRVGKELTGVYSAEYLISAYGDYPLVPNTGAEAGIRKIVAGLANVEPSDCELQ